MIQIHVSVLLITALWLLVLPLDWFMAAVIASSIHEICHIFVLYALKGNMHSITVSARGCIIKTDVVEDWKQVCSIFAGPIGSILLLSLHRILPKVAVCGLIHAVYNFLPMLPMDGGRLLRLFLNHYFPTYVEKIMNFIKFTIYLSGASLLGFLVLLDYVIR